MKQRGKNNWSPIPLLLLKYRLDPCNFVQMGIFVHIYLALCCHGKNNVDPNMKTQSYSWKTILLENPFPQQQPSMPCLV